MLYVKYYNLLTKLKKKERKKEYKRLEDIKYDSKKLDGFYLYCYDEKIIEIPKNIFEFINLEYLEITNKQKHEKLIISKEIGNLKNLIYLCLDNNNISDLPKEIGNLTNLQKLYLRNNNLTELPKELFNLINLEILYFDSNNIQIIPKDIGKLKKLVYLTFRYNYISELPLEITNCINLKHINEEHNYLYNDKQMDPVIDKFIDSFSNNKNHEDFLRYSFNNPPYN
jgi:Leucine-rich repeat (LRR) protein